MNWYLLLIVSITVEVLAIILTPFLPLFATKDAHLPKWLFWFDTPDNPIDGDSGFIETHPKSCYWNRMVWLFRNRAYGFSWSRLGAEINETPKVVSGDIWVGNKAAKSTGRITGKSGDVHITCGKYWEKYHVSQWGNTGKCNRYRFGWKLSGYVQDPDNYKLGTKAQFVFSWNPLMGFDTGESQ